MTTGQMNQPHLIHRPSGYTLVVWPDGAFDVLETKEAQAMIEQMALCCCAMEARE